VLWLASFIRKHEKKSTMIVCLVQLGMRGKFRGFRSTKYKTGLESAQTEAGCAQGNVNCRGDVACFPEK
jgi:hypothetical protein